MFMRTKSGSRRVCFCLFTMLLFETLAFGVRWRIGHATSLVFHMRQRPAECTTDRFSARVHCIMLSYQNELDVIPLFFVMNDLTKRRSETKTCIQRIHWADSTNEPDQEFLLFLSFGLVPCLHRPCTWMHRNVHNVSALLCTASSTYCTRTWTRRRREHAKRTIENE